MQNKLEDSIKKCMQTIMIGSIASIEKHYGFLFGHGKIKLSTEEESLKNIFMDIRSDILDLGNDQINKIISILHLYEVDGPKYKYQFKITKETENEN